MFSNHQSQNPQFINNHTAKLSDIIFLLVKINFYVILRHKYHLYNVQIYYFFHKKIKIHEQKL